MIQRRMGLPAILVVLPLLLGAAPQTKKIYLANDDHTDFMWSANASRYQTAFLQMLDYYLDQADATSGDASEFQSRFSADGSYWLWTYEANRSAAAFERLVGRMKSGHITAPMTLLHLGYGAMPAEAVLRSLYYAGKLERRYGLKFKLAVMQENQSLPYGLGALWAGAGVSYSWRGICGCASRIPDAWDRPLDMYWWTGPDGSRILMKWYSQLRRDPYGIGGYAEASDAASAINQTDEAEFRRRIPYSVVGLFGYGGDNLETRTDAIIRAAREATTSDRKVIVSNEVDFFEDFEKTHGASLPSSAVSFGNEWELLTASLAELSGSVKRGVERLRAAEAMAALVAAKDAGFMSGRDKAREAAWIKLGLYFEHDWTADGPISRDERAAWEREQASGFLDYVETLASDAASALGRMIRKEGSRRRFFVFNPLSWNRTGAADLDLGAESAVHAVELTTGRETPSQWVGPDSARRLRIWAEDVPSLGYKVFEIVPGAGQAFGDGPTAAGAVLENGLYRITLAPNGALDGLVDKSRSGRDFVRVVGGLRMNELGPGGGTVSVTDAGPVSVTLKAVSSSPIAHTVQVTLYRGGDRIDVRDEITAGFSGLLSWSYGLALENPEAWHEEVGAVIKAKPEAEGGQYANRNLRRDWLTLNHFVDLSGGGLGMTISSADNLFFKLGESSVEAFDTTTPRVQILAGGQVDGPSLGIPNQGGATYFLQRFGLRTHDAFDAVEAMRFALDHQNPFVSGEVHGGTAYPAESFSFLTLDDPGVVVWAVKPAEDGSENRTVIRLWNLRDSPAAPTLTLGDLSILDAEAVTHIETPAGKIPAQSTSLTVDLAGRQWRTFSLALSGAAAAGKGIGRGKIR
jgi:alpha-mannosidase